MGKYACKKKPLKKPFIFCGWIGCNYQCDGEAFINSHISMHIEKIREDISNIRACEFKCSWQTCIFSSDNWDEMERHMYFHGYYSGLLARGKLECESNSEIPKCYMTTKETVLPILKKDFSCEWSGCKRKFLSILEFHAHVQDHANFDNEIQKTPDKKRQINICNWCFCKRRFDNKYRLIEHISKHINKKGLACYQCGETFRTKTTLFDHLRRQPENNTHSFQCAQCFKFFSTEKLLRNHVVQHVNYFKCSLCDMTCPNISMLTTHVRYRHLKDRPFKCESCEVRFVRESDLTRHVQMVHLKEVFRCEQAGCYYTVRSYNLLRRHFLEVHNNSPFIYICHCCDKSFKAAKNLSSHLIKKHEFQLPSGHKRFTYRVDENGFYRLETMRIESLEVTQQFNTSIKSNAFDSTDSAATQDVTQDSSCYEIVSMNDERIIVSNDPVEAHLVGEVVISLPTETINVDEEFVQG